MEFLKADSIFQESANTYRREVLLSSGGPQCGKVWSELPRHCNDFIDNDHFKMAMFIRLGAVQVPAGAVCQIPRKDDMEKCLTAIDNPMVHPFVCEQGPARLRIHRSLNNKLALLLRKTGAHVDLERAVPALFTVDGHGNTTEAILDVVFSHPGGLSKSSVDVTVRTPHARSYEGTDTVPGAAAQAGEFSKRERYGEAVMPLSFECYGRLGAASAKALYTIVLHATAFCNNAYGQSPARCYSRWRAALERVLTYEVADKVLLSLGQSSGLHCLRRRTMANSCGS